MLQLQHQDYELVPYLQQLKTLGAADLSADSDVVAIVFKQLAIVFKQLAIVFKQLAIVFKQLVFKHAEQKLNTMIGSRLLSCWWL